MESSTLPETNIVPENRPPPIGKYYSNHLFLGAMLVSGRVRVFFCGSTGFFLDDPAFFAKPITKVPGRAQGPKVDHPSMIYFLKMPPPQKKKKQYPFRSMYDIYIFPYI